MAGMCFGVVGEAETPAKIKPSTRTARRKRLEIRQLKFVADVDIGRKRAKLETCPPSPPPRQCENAVENCDVKEHEFEEDSGETKKLNQPEAMKVFENDQIVEDYPKFGMTSVCGRRRDMEDAVAIHLSLCTRERDSHFFGVYDGHGCSHVSLKCKERLHEIVREELNDDEAQWVGAMERSFLRMDKEVQEWSNSATTSDCRCELQTPQCDAVGSTAVVAIVTPRKIVVSNCGDSRAVLCRNGVAVPLSSDHKPDRPDELHRIQAAGGRVIYWDGPRVLGVLAMSRAIGDDYLKPYVTALPEVTVTDRTTEDECLILASDGLWDVVDNDTACGVVRMCLRAQRASPPPSPPQGNGGLGEAAECSDKACSDAAILLTKLALARHSSDNVSVVVVDLRRNVDL
ncbi:protein phosphatase 2C 37-like [Malania oleifera]|uniref:protein phosphatase 2C 37-like n=1 Tax=Malania oleifera TaxID=397392 RepID=UPI0025ADA37B|nr:protein phosphatase 2C 37-like [Malania oleifera]